MLFQFQHIVSALALTATLANAAVVPRSKSSFTVHQVAVPKNSSNAFNHYATALRKHRGRLPEALAVSFKKTPTGSGEGTAQATPIGQDMSYLLPVTVGKSTLNLDLDTGSSDLWVFSSETPKNQRGDHDIYQPSSTGKKIPNSSWSISYLDGSGASGAVYIDKVSIGNVSFDKQGVEAALSASESFTKDSDNDGLIGMAFSSINSARPRQNTFFENIANNLDEPLFTASLKHNAPGSYDFGFIDKTKYTGELTYTDVDSSDGFWNITVDSYSVGNQTGEGFTAVIDTGTTLVLIDEEVVNTYYRQVKGARFDYWGGLYAFDCNSELPDFTLKINSKEAKIPGKLIKWAEQEGECVGGIQSSNGGDNILGDIFLKSQYAVFENKNGSPRFGFAPQA
ncbi:Type I transmembrane sorting receptor [Ascosphaera aggregata]|nr:Type I transmembrane sorting receptor [Ascosphaera aggregata]